MPDDTASVSVFDVRAQALAMAIDAKDEGETDAQTMTRARLFYDFLLQDARPPVEPPKAPNEGGGVVPFKGKKH